MRTLLLWQRVGGILYTRARDYYIMEQVVGIMSGDRRKTMEWKTSKGVVAANTVHTCCFLRHTTTLLHFVQP